MYQLLRFLQLSDRKPRIPRLMAAGTSLLTVLMILLWLWGPELPDQISAVSDELRDTVRLMEPQQTKLRALGKQFEKARREGKDVALVLGEIRCEIDSVDESIKRLEKLQDEDRVLLEQLGKRISKITPDETVEISGKSFTCADLEQDAQLILNRCAARREQIREYCERRTELEQLRSQFVAVISDHRTRLNSLEIGLERARIGIERGRLSRWCEQMQGWRANGEALSRAEQNLSELLKDLNREQMAREAMNELTQGGPAEELRGELNAEPIIDQINDLIGL